MYTPSELLSQVEKEIRAEFKDLITCFESFHEEEYTSIIVEIRKTAGQNIVIRRSREIIDAIVGEAYIVSLLVRPIERVGESNGLFNLVYSGGVDSFFVKYYAPERPRSTPFSAAIYSTQFMKAMRTIRIDSPFELWERLFSPAYSRLANKKGVSSFSAKNLACDLRDFLLKHLDFIESIAQATGRSLEILDPLPQLTVKMSHSTNGAGASPPEMLRRQVVREHELALQ